MKKGREEIGTDPIRRFYQLYKVRCDGEEPVIIAALNTVDAVEKAAAEYGISAAEARQTAQITEPTAAEIVEAGRRRGEAVEMQVSSDQYGMLRVRALCRADAVAQACCLWGADYGDAQRSFRVAVSRRVELNA